MNNKRHIVIEDVDMVYDRGQLALHALAAINLTLDRGQFVSLIGPSGCGKSTLLRIAGGLQTATAGRVLIDGHPPSVAQREKQLGFVFQDASLLPWLNVIDNVRLPLQINHRRQRNESSDGAKARGDGTVKRGPPDPAGVVELVGLGGFQRYYPHQLSGGMQQRVALARSFVTRPSVLLMDEPFGALDEITRDQMRHELLHVWRSEAAVGCTVLFVTHSIAEAVLLSDRVIMMTPQPGRIAADLAIDLPRPRPDGIEFDARFIQHTQTLRGLLREHARV